jgi:hypothetical protein
VRLFVVGSLIGALLFSAMLVESGGDPFVIAAVGQDGAVVRNLVEAELDRPVVVRPGPGHDGSLFLLQALDPFYLDDITAQTDRPVYRGQRLVYPLLAGLGGSLPLAAIPWAMALIHILSFGIGVAATGRLVERQGHTPWWGLAFALNPGVWAGLHIGGAGTLALATGILGVLYTDQRRFGRAAAVFTASVLTREVMLLMVAGTVLQEWRRSGRLKVGLVIWPVTASAVLALYLRLQIVSSTDAGVTKNLGPPFVGLIEAAPYWARTPAGLLFALTTIAAVVIVVVVAIRTTELLPAATAPFAVLFVALTAAVANENFDYSRAIAPAYTAAVLVIAHHLPAPLGAKHRAGRVAGGRARSLGAWLRPWTQPTRLRGPEAS